MGIAAGEVTARCAHVGHEQGVAHKHGVTDLIGHAGGGVTRHCQRLGLQLTDVEDLVVVQQLVELAAIGAELGLQMEDFLEHVLHLRDGRANRDLSTQLVAKVVRGRQMVCVGMGLQNPLHRQPLTLHKRDDLVGRPCAGAAGLRVVVQHRIHHRAVAARLIEHHIAHRPGGVIKEGFYLGLHRRAPYLISMLIVY